LNKEFLKGIQARERVVTLKKIHSADSIQLRIYKDSLIPSYDSALTLAVEDVDFLNNLLIEEEQENRFYKSGFFTSLGLLVLLLIFN
jgi:hypothetical protein